MRFTARRRRFIRRRVGERGDALHRRVHQAVRHANQHMAIFLGRMAAIHLQHGALAHGGARADLQGHHIIGGLRHQPGERAVNALLLLHHRLQIAERLVAVARLLNNRH
jgi:hypothetical protein